MSTGEETSEETRANIHADLWADKDRIMHKHLVGSEGNGASEGNLVFCVCFSLLLTFIFPNLLIHTPAQ